MPTLASIPTLDQQAIAKKIKELSQQLTIEARLELEADINRSISEELADKKAECGKNNHKWKEYLQEHGITQKDASKRIKLARVPKLLWSVGTVMAMQLATPMYEVVCDQLAQEEVITQELAEQEMAKVRAEIKMRREAQKQPENKPAPNIFKTDINGIEYWEVGKVYEQYDAGKTLQGLVDRTGRIPQSIIVDAIMHFANNLPLGYLSQEQPRRTPALSKLEPGMRIRVHGHQFAGEEGEVVTAYDGEGWSVILDCHRNEEATIPTRLKPSQIEIIG